MASNQTVNFGLNQWSAEDKVLREEFNADNAKIDAAFKAMENTMSAGLAAAQKAPCCVTGSYAGGANSSKTTVNLGFRPGFLVIIRGAEPIDSAAAVAVIGNSDCRLSVRFNSSNPLDTAVTITDTGFTVSGSSTDRYGMNYSGSTYYYTAFY